MRKARYVLSGPSAKAVLEVMARAAADKAAEDAKLGIDPFDPNDARRAETGPSILDALHPSAVAAVLYRDEFDYDDFDPGAGRAELAGLLHEKLRAAEVEILGKNPDVDRASARRQAILLIVPEELGPAPMGNPFRWFTHNDGIYRKIPGQDPEEEDRTDEESAREEKSQDRCESLDLDSGQDADRDKTRRLPAGAIGAMLALDLVPGELTIGRHPVDPDREENPENIVTLATVTDVEINFFDGEAPAQIHRLPGRHGGPAFLRRDRLDEVLVDKVNAPNSFRRAKRVHIIMVDQGMHPDFVNDRGDDGAIRDEGEGEDVPGDRTYAGILWNPTQHPQPAPGLLPTEHRDRYRSWPQWHAHMMVRNIVDIAGDNRELEQEQPQNGKLREKMIRFWDVPIVPDRVADVLGTAMSILLAYQQIENFIDDGMPSNDCAIIVNAWGVKNRFRETPLGDFTEDSVHLLNAKIDELSRKPKSKAVFASGNNGLFAVDPQAGALDRGPGRSVFLPAALEEVWAVGAADVNGTWIGLSSQGPGVTTRSGDSEPKPDFNLPSHFAEDMDAHVLNTGSSASCALMAGILAEHWRDKTGTPRLDHTTANARKRGHLNRSNRLGEGVPQRRRVRN